MHGKNEIHVNQETMAEAMQLWLDAQFKKPPKVTTVRKNTNTPGATCDHFILTVYGPEKPASGEGSA